MDTDHINYLVYRYLQESGFAHSSFTFGLESGVTRSAVARTKIPPGALIVQLQRALNYVQAEVGMGEDGTPCDIEELGGAEALTLIDSVQPEVCEKRRKQLWESKRGEGGGAADDGPVNVNTEVTPQHVRVLSGHEGEVYACAWHPATNVLASGSGDSTARIWSLEAGSAEEPLVLRHIADGADSSPEVCALDWNRDGTLLATGSYDAIGRIWTKGGELQNYLRGHEGAIFSLKWNRRGDYVVTASFDESTIVWDAARGTKLQQFKFHKDACLDVHWRSNEMFASCSRDKDIFVCEVGKKAYIRVYKGDPTSAIGHHDEVNNIKWDPTGKYLASSSDDCTARIWDASSDSLLHTLSHEGKIYSLDWGQPSAGSQLPLMLATASCDHTTKVWDAMVGRCILVLSGHTEPVYSVAFSPDSRFLATGAFDNKLLLYSMETGDLVKSHHSRRAEGAGIYEVRWNAAGNKVAACYADKGVSVIDFQG